MKHGVGESPADALDHWEGVAPRAHEACNITRGPMTELELSYFGHIMRRRGSLQKTGVLGKIGAGQEGDQI